MKYGSVCSGVEAASVAWDSLDWTPVFFSEIEPFPSAVLSHHWPNVPNHGDMTKFEEWGYESGDIDVLVGGTPCQSFSLAGLRGGLEDERGNLALTYCRMVDRLRPKWTIWENVPGVLSSNGGRDFGSIIGAMDELGYSVAWRVLDAQNFGVPQRRRRVFLVGCASGDWRDPSKILFERNCGGRNFEKSKKEKQRTTEESVECFAGNKQSDVAATIQTTCHDYSRADGFNTILHHLAIESNRRDGLRIHGQTTQTLQAFAGTGGGNTPMVFHGAQDPIMSEKALPIGRNQGQENCLQSDRAIRRLTPTECERLQGFPDNHTNIPWRNKDHSPDSGRYKAMGNSMAVPVMRWIGERIERHK